MENLKRSKTKHYIKAFLQQLIDEGVEKVSPKELFENFFIDTGIGSHKTVEARKKAQELVGNYLHSKNGLSYKCLRIIEKHRIRSYKFEFLCPVCEKETFELYGNDLRNRENAYVCKKCRPKRRSSL